MPADSDANRSTPAVCSPTKMGLALLVLLLAAEIGLLGLAVANQLPPRSVLGLHLLNVAVYCGLAWRPFTTGSDGGIALIAVVTTLATGPFGAAGTLLLPRLARRKDATDDRLAAWYNRIALSTQQDSFTKLSDRVAIGRAANLAAPSPTAFCELFEGERLPEQQAALGRIARHFHPGYLAVLQSALDSPEPVIRVQAAAVATRVRGQLADHVEALIARASTSTLSAAEATDLAAEIKSCTVSGLLSDSEKRRAMGIHDAVLSRMFAGIDAQRPDGVTGEFAAGRNLNSGAFEAYASHLLAQSRFAEFRALRRRMRHAVRGRFRRRVVVVAPRSARLMARVVRR